MWTQFPYINNITYIKILFKSTITDIWENVNKLNSE